MCISGYLAYSSIDNTVVSTQQLVVVPGQVTNDGWGNLESVLITDLSGDALYQAFSSQNSATIIADDLPNTSGTLDEQGTGELPNTETAPVTTSDTESGSLPDESSSSPSESSDTNPTDSGSDSPASQEDTQLEPETSPQPAEVVSPVSSLTPVSSFAVVTTTERFPWAQFSETVPNDELTNTQVDITPIEASAAEIEDPLDIEVSSDTASPPEVGDANLPDTTNPGTEQSGDTGEATDEVISDDTTEADTVDSADEVFSGLTPCVSEEGCVTRSMTFSGFELPEFEPGTLLDAAQLRLSMAAQSKNSESLQRFVVSYSIDNGQTWLAGTVIDIEDEQSNSINGDYYLVSLDVPPATKNLSELQVRVTYEGVIEQLEGAFLDGVWLEVTSGTFYETGAVASTSDAITYERDLSIPKFHTLHNDSFDITSSELPGFTMSYDPQQGFLRRMFNLLFAENVYEVGRVELRDGNGELLPLPYEVVYNDDTTWTVRFTAKPQKMLSGKYEVRLFVQENEVQVVDSFEFYWGVLAVNTKKTMYFKDEEVILNLAALTDRGDTICDADMSLKVISPSNTISDIPVTQTGFCGKNNVTDKPDYEAIFTDTGEYGRYTVQLEHRNVAGEVVHRITDSFEVREYIPFDITRTAPTRIYPPAPYTVTLDIKANRSFTGDIVERVPRGFVFADTSGAVVTTLADATVLTWSDITMEEGESRQFTYVFDAPDISPYMYLLGPLDMDGFSELRQWQIASDAISSAAWLTATSSQIGANVNDPSAAALIWSTSTVDSFYFNHATSSTPERLFIRRDGDYLVSVTLPLERTDAVAAWSRVGFEVRVNGVVVPQAIGRSGLISNTLSTNRQNESSSHGNFLLTDLNEGDYVEVYVQALSSYTAQPVFISGEASLYVEHIPQALGVFAGTATRTVASTSFNTATSEVQWIETRQDTGFLHSDTVSPEDIVINDPGTYMVFVNMPFESFGAVNPYRNVLGRVLLDGVQVPGGVFSQGTLIVTANADNRSSSHWSGLVVTATTSQVLSISMEQEGAAGTTTVPAGFTGSIYIQKLPSSDIIALRGQDLTGGANWNVDPFQSILWNTQLAYDTGVYTHSTTTNSHQITVNQGGDYVLSYNSALFSTGGVNNVIVGVRVNGNPVIGAQTKTHYITNAGGQLDSSGSLVYNLDGLAPGDVVSLTVLRDANTTVVNDRTDAMLMLWKKKEFNFRPGAATMFNVPFDNVRFASTTPFFEFSTTDPDGTSDLVYQFELATTSDFAGAIVRTSDTDLGFLNTASTSDLSPFVEGNRIRYQLQSGDALSSGVYYWRVRAKDVTGSDEFGDWSTTQSLTVDVNQTVPSWYQTTGPQFLTNVLTGVASVDGDGAVVDIAENTEAVMVYGEKTDTLLKYRFWNGSSWGNEVNGPSVGAEIYWTESAAGITRDEYVAVTLTADGDTNALVYSASTTLWSSPYELVTDVNTPARRGIGVTYETISGDAMVVSCSAAGNPVYSIWNGATWSATTTISVASASNCNWIRLASDPTSDEIIMLIKGAADTYEALVWNGSSWGNSKTLGRVAGTNLATDGMSVVYSESGDLAMFVSTDAGDNEFMYTTWDGTSWSANVNYPLPNDFEVGQLVSDVGTDRIGFCLVDAGADIHAGIWDGTAWGTFTILEPATESTQSRPVDCEFETFAGRDGYFSVAYSDANTDEYQFFNGTSWSGPLNLTDMEEFWYLQMLRTGNGTLIAAGMENNGIDPLRVSQFNGTSWSANTLIEADPAEIGVDPRSESFSMSARRFSFAQGIVRTNPITFSAVPGRSTWGDVSFTTTEPVGTNVTVRLKYTATTTCDTYIPNGVLAGNGVGFTSTSSPINISALSTSTYSQICLEATISRTGPVSASLDDWEVTWVRQPKLIQRAYRWYTNGSFYTPTDAWPLGVFDVAENTPISATEAISINESIRLRIAAEGLNIDLATDTAAFKLQYAEGLTCSPTLAWRDVGGIGSSTATWRGYANSVIDTDWYDAAWTRRVKITIDHTLVDADLTDFPVYVNLDDLPAVFFDNVQSDGDDIRVTNIDGVTELPYELVSINTATDRGELHFRANLASTTNSEFYIYYGNPSASGYAATAPYGRNNVWSNNFYAVYHLDTTPTSPMTDSTGNGRTLTGQVGIAATNSTSTLIGNGIFFDGNDRLTNASLSWPNTNNPVTVTAWNNVTTAQVQNSNLFGFTAVGNERFATHAPWGDNVIYWDYGTCCASPGRVNTNYTAYRNKWTHVGLVSQGGGGTFMGIYLDGSLITSIGTSDDPNVALTGFSLGSDNPTGGNHHRGLVDEFRIATVARSGTWLSTEENNQSNPTGFYDVSAEEIVNDNRPLPSTLLTGSDYAETYEQENPTRLNLNNIVVGNQAEWDFVLQNNAGAASTNYCFRLVYENGSLLSSYDEYPRLITNAPPLRAENSAPFANEQLASTSPWFEFAAADELDDDVSYVIEVSTDPLFGSVLFSRDSNPDFSLFTNLSNVSERSLYTPGQTIRFIPDVTLANNTTYWWRVRAKDDNGSGASGEWSVPTSFTVNTATAITTWFQTTEEQFATDELLDAVVTTSDDIRIAPGFTAATTTSSEIRFADVDTGNAWGELLFTDNESTGDIKYSIEYLVSGSEWALVPDTVLPGNAAGFDTTGVSLLNLDVEVYHTLRVRAVLTGDSNLPRLESWSVTWGLRIEPPIHADPFDNAKVDTLTPELWFVTSDPQNDALQYEIQIDTNASFSSPTTVLSGVDAGFVNNATPADTSPFNSGETIVYTVQSALTNGSTYWWRVRARDPLPGENAYSDWSEPTSFTVDLTLNVSTWFQTTGEQFATNDLTTIQTTAGSAEVTTIVNGAMTVYGESTTLTPRYRLWNGAEWSDPQSALSVGAFIEWTVLQAAPLRNEYALATLGTDGDVNLQIFDAGSGTWGDLFEIQTEIANTNLRAVDIAYESNSGDLVAVSCDGQDAIFTTWNGTSWSATTSIPLTKAANCEYVKLASDPTSDELIAVFRHGITGTPDYEALVWNGASWGNAVQFGNMAEAANEGIAVEYEASGNQAVVVVSDDGNASFLYNTWNGSSWSGVLSNPMQDDFEHAVLKRDVNTDRLALCNIDQDGQISNVFWNGAAWDSRTLIEATGNSQAGRPVSCEFETTPGREGYLMIPYSDTADVRYQFYATSSYSGELPLGTLTDAWTTQTIRTADGLILMMSLRDEGVAPADRYEFSYWNGTAWQAEETISGVPSVTGIPFHESIAMAAQIFPNFTEGVVRSTPIEFADGDGPRWQSINWTDVTPGASTIRYRVYYQSAPGVFTLVPNSAIAGNAAGFTDGPIDISSLDTSLYATLQLEASLQCSLGDCPALNDWQVEWSEGIIVSGTAFEYDQTTPMATGTVAIAVNGVLQVGKTSPVSSGLITQKAVIDTTGTTTFTVPAGVTELTVKAWGAGGAGGAGGTRVPGASGGGGGFAGGTIAVTPAENLTVRIGGAGNGGVTGSPAGGGGGGGYTALYRSSSPLLVAGGGGGGGAGAGGISYVGVGTACLANNATCTPTVPGGLAVDDVLIAVVKSRTDTVHTCTTNCGGWTEFSVQAGGANGRLSVWYYRATSTTPVNPTFAGPATDTYTARIWAFRGVTPFGDPFDTRSANTAQAANVLFTGSGITTTVPNAMPIFVGGALDDNTWGPAGGVCTIPGGVVADFYASNINGNDNSIFLCYDGTPTSPAGPQSVPTMTQATLGADAGRHFTFALRPATSTVTSAGAGGVGGGVTGGAGAASGASNGGGAGTQSAGGAAGSGLATAGGSLFGGNGGTGTGGGAGGNGGTFGGGNGGTGDATSARAGGGGGGAGYFGGGGGAEAASSTLSGAGGGGGSSFIVATATATSTASGTGTTAANSGDVDYVSGVGAGGAGGALTSNGSNGGGGLVVLSWTATTTVGAWSISNVNAEVGDVITVFINGATSSQRTVGVTKYDGVGDVTGMELNARHLTIGSDDNSTTTNIDIGRYDGTDDADLIHTVNGANELILCGVGACGDARLKIKAGSTYQPLTNSTIINLQNYGRLALGTSTLRVAGAWQQLGTFVTDTSTVVFTATSTPYTLQNATSSFFFHNVTFGETSGTATWTIDKPLSITGTLSVMQGTLARGTSTMAIGGNLTLGANGFVTGIATTTFNGTGSNTWSDAKASASSTNVGNVVIDGTAKTITLAGNVAAESVTIGTDDTLNASGSGFNINVVRAWTNNNLFVPQTGTVTFIGTSTGVIARGTSPFNNLTFAGVGGNWSFSTSTLALNGTLTIATGTVTLPTGTTTIAGSFLNTGGSFAHNNGEVRMTSAVGGRTITQQAGVFTNAFYDLVFTGGGTWSYSESAATTTRNMLIQAGTVTLPSGQLTVGGEFAVTGSGAFAHNNGELVLLVTQTNTLRTNGSALNNVRTRGVGSGSWYGSGWGRRLSITVQSSQVPTNLSDFPVYVNLANLPVEFFNGVKADGGDIRMTTSDGVTEVPVEVVSLNTGARTGELHFRAPSLSSTTNSVFYIYYNNPAAATNTATSTFGRANVWSNGYEAVYHLDTNPASAMLDSTRNARNLTQLGGMNSSDVVAGAVGNGIDFDGVDDRLTNAGFAWPNASNTVTVTAWNNVTVAETKAANLFGFNESGGQRFATHGPWSDSVLYWDFGTAGVPGRVQTAYNSYRDKWTHVALTSPGNGGGNMNIYLDGAFIAGSAASDPTATLTGFFLGSLGAGQYHDGRIDEFRIASVVRTAGWIATEENNQSSSTAFYTVSGEETQRIRTFADTNTTILGNVVLENGGDAIFPSGVLSVGGSFDNNANFTSNNGTVRFNSIAGSETIAAGSSTFATLEFNATSGDFAITEHATATVAVNLVNAASFTLSSGLSLTASGTFTQVMSGASTTWTGSTLRILGADQTIHAKTFGGDVYGTLETNGDTDVAMWNSSATSYVTGSTSSIYSQDHAGVDGDLNIYGNYVRSTGTEHWSWETDFDGVSLGVGARQVDVRIATGSTIGFVNASWSIQGTTSATTTVASIAGAFSVSATNTTVTGRFFSFANTDASGLRLVSSSTVSVLDDGFFTVAPGQTGITMDGTTVGTNPARQFNRIGFATTTAGAASNVTFTGTSTTFVWFRNGSGNLYGEAFDAGDLNPGAIRFDDSSYLITVSGRVLTNNGSGVQGAPVCNGTTPNVRIVVNNGSFTASTSCNATTGAYTFNNVAFVGDPVISVYLNTNGGVQGSVVTKTPTANITNLDLYTNQVMMRHEGVVPIAIADLVQFNNASDTDMGFVATTSPTTTLTVSPARGLFIWASSTFTPGGPVTLAGNASTSAFEGSLTLATSSRFIAEGTQTHTLAGRLVLGSNASITAASSTFVFNATTTGKSITGSTTINLHNASFTGVGGAWNITAPIVFTGDMTVATGTVTGTSNLTLTNGQLTGNGTLSLGGGTTTIARTNTLGGTTPWTFANLVLGDGLTVGTTTRAASATTTISGRLTIANAHTLAATSEAYDFTGTGTVFQVTGTWQPGSSLVRYSGANANVLGTSYYDLSIGALVGSSTFTGTGSGILVGRNLTVGNGTASSTFNVTTSDPVVTVLGDVLIQSSSTLSASDIATTTIAGSYDNNGRFFGNGGLVNFTGSGSHTIAAGSSSLSRVIVDGTGSFTLPESATTTVSLILQNHSLFTVATGTTLAVAGTFENRLGGSATVWSGALFAHGGGSLTINQKTTSDVYSTLRVASTTRVRMWNSTSTVYDAQGGIYSQDHAGIDGALRIYGNFNETSAADHWSFETDFDGTTLGTSTRPVTVAFASNATATWSGGSLSVIGSTSASTTLQNQGSGTYRLVIGGTATVNFNRVVIRDTTAAGITFTGTPTVTDFSRTDHLIRINSGTALTVGGTVINANEAKNFTNNVFAPDTGVIGATNVTATGTAVSSWRFTNHTGSISGEAFDVDPAGDPGYIVWDDSAALITVSGNVYSDEGVTVSPVCDGVTNNIVLRVAGLTSYSTSCNASTGAYSISNVAYSPLDSLVVYIDGATPKGAHVTKSPISSISNLHIYHSRVIVRHENTDPITIADMAVWDSSDDTDIPFTAVDAGTDTLTLPADRKLMVWTSKTFAPNGNVTISGGGAGDAVDGSFEALANARFRGQNSETHTIAGSFVFGAGAVYEANQATTTFTSTAAGRTIDVNESAFGNIAFTGTGSWSMSDATLTTQRSFTQSAGTVTFGSGTTTIGASFNATGGTFTMNGSALVFTSTSTGNIVRFDDSTVPTTTFSGASGAWSMTDTNATTTGSFFITNTGTVTLPSGNLGVGGSFVNASGTVTHNTSDIYFTGAGTLSLRANGSDLFAVRKIGAGTLTMTEGSVTLRDDLAVASGTLIAATNTLAVGGSFTVTNGFFNNATGTVLMNATTVGKTIQASTSPFYNLNFGSASGGWTWQSNATVTNNMTITAANTFTKESGTTLTVGGVFTNLVGGAQTTWSTTTLRLIATDPYTINTKSAGGDVYATVDIPSADIRVWNSSFSTTTTGLGASLYSQDNAAVDGQLAIYGEFTVATTTEHWSFATDFDGTALTGPSQRAVSVLFASSATTSVISGTLNVIGGPSATTTIGIIGTGTHALAVSGGTFNAQFYRFNALNATGLSFTGSPTITTLSNGFYQLAVNGGTLVRVTDTALTANASKIFTAVGFNATSGLSGVNVALVGSTSNAWRFSGSYGTLSGEAFDDDGVDACGAIRFDNSLCLLTSQTAFRWRSDDGLEGAPSSEWFDASFDYRQRVRVQNTTGTSFSTTTLKIVVPYDSAMQSDFDDIRFTLGNGLTLADHWRERFTASTEATFWVEVPSFAASSYTTVFMYYGSSTASSASNASASFVFVDDFEDNNITEYSGDTSLFQTDTAPVFAGTYALEASNKTGRTTDGIYRTGSLVSQGQIVRYMQYVDTTLGSTDEGCVMFGVQGNQNQNYGVCLELFGVDRIALSRDVDDNDVSGTVLASTTVSYTTGWYEVQIDWQTNNRIDVYLYNPSGALVATTSATDSNYTSGGVGYTFWIQNGAWDSYTVRGRAPVTPPVFFGAKQTDGGATWLAAQNASGSGLPGSTRRLRIGIENSGLTVTGQTYRLQYAAKGSALTCEAVSSGSYTAVPNQASCGSSPVCMQTSTNVTDGGATTDLLSGMNGMYSAGQTVESPSNMTGGITINQNYYTELEYVITATVNASDAYCFRVVNDTTPLDFYAEVAELGLTFDPTFGPVALNNGMPIVLTPGATTTVYATGTVTDFNGVADLVAGTSTIYRSGAGAACTPDNNNCYVSTVSNGGCNFTNCSGSTCTLECRADIFFHADPTDDGAYAGEEWLAYLEVNDVSGGYDFASALGVELLTLRALTVDNGINYGALEPANNTGAYNATTTIANTGNVAFDIEVAGTDLSDGSSSVIPATEQRFATSTFNYAACVSCASLSSTTPVELAVNLAKPTAPSPLPETPIYWGIAVPLGIRSAPHSGINVFTPISP